MRTPRSAQGRGLQSAFESKCKKENRRHLPSSLKPVFVVVVVFIVVAVVVQWTLLCVNLKFQFLSASTTCPWAETGTH